MDQENKNKSIEQEGVNSFVSDVKKIEGENKGLERDPYQAEILNEIRAGICRITGLELSIIHTGEEVPKKPYSFDLSAIAQSGKKSEVLAFLERWLNEINDRIEGSMFFAEKYFLELDSNNPYSVYEYADWQDLPTHRQRFILSLEIKQWVNKVIIGLMAENTPSDLGKVHAQLSLQMEPLFKLPAKGSKINAIRVLDAFYEVMFIENPNGMRTTKLEFMVGMGAVLGFNLKDYDQDLSQSFNNSKCKHLEIFDRLKQTAIEKFDKKDQ